MTFGPLVLEVYPEQPTEMNLFPKLKIYQTWELENDANDENVHILRYKMIDHFD